MIYSGIVSFDGDFSLSYKISRSDDNYLLINKELFCVALPHRDRNFHIYQTHTSIIFGRILTKKNDSLIDDRFLEKVNKDNVNEHFWGEYVYIETNGGNVHIVSDPTGQLPFFYTRTKTNQLIFASNLSKIYEVDERQKVINWDYLTRYIVRGHCIQEDTPFCDIYTIRPGFCYTFKPHNGVSKYPVWKPWKQRTNLATQDYDEAIYNSLHYTLKSLVEPYDHVFLSLSGGLDSSSLALVLSETIDSQKITAINHFHPSISTSDERVYARQICKEYHINLIEMNADEYLPFNSYSHPLIPHLPDRPLPSFTQLALLQSESRLIESKKNSIMINGQGGDHIFMSPPTKLSIADFFLEKGFNGISKKIIDILDIYRDPLWGLIKENLSALMRRMLSQHITETIQTEIPPWLSISPMKEKVVEERIRSLGIYECYPGKYHQILALLDGLASVQNSNHQWHRIAYPFLCEPLIEVALSIPTYNLFDQGLDRYPLRSAMGKRFSTKNIWRRDKGEITGVFQKGLEKNFKYLTELCMNGKFVREKIVNPDQLYASILALKYGSTEGLWPLTHLSSCEIFLNEWGVN